MPLLTEITDAQMAKAEARMQKRIAEGPTAIAVAYRSDDGRLVIELSNGASFAIPARIIQGLEEATDEDLKSVEITPPGDGLHFPAVDADVLVLPLLAGVLGSSSFMAKRLGKAGGSSRSPLKAEAARANGARGGRPRKIKGEDTEPPKVQDSAEK
jgi:hypothetical protein